MITDLNLDAVRRLAADMAGRTPVSSAMLLRLVSEIETGGPVADLLTCHPAKNTPLFAVRALAGVRYLVLTGRAPRLAKHLEGMLEHQADPSWIDRTWRLFRQTVPENPVQIVAALDRLVQHHRPDRARFLLRGLGMLAVPRVRLFELGACAGLNLVPDRYRWIAPDWAWGDPGSKVRLAASGPAPGPVSIVERAGCDVRPRDPRDPDDVAVLKSFLPHELSVAEMELQDAIELAAVHGVRVDQADAAGWLAQRMQWIRGHDTCTVVWHSFFWGYLNSRQQSEIEDVLADAARRTSVATISYEPVELSGPARLKVQLYS